MTPDDIVQTLVEARKHLHACLHALVPLHDRIKEREAGLEHVRRQIQNADIIASFMERAWTQPPALDMTKMALDEKTGFTPVQQATFPRPPLKCPACGVSEGEMHEQGCDFVQALILHEPAPVSIDERYVPTSCPDCGGEGIMHKTWCRR